MLNCNSPNCPFDLWAPGPRHKIENVAFSCYAKSTQDIEDFIDDLAAVTDPNDSATQNYLAAAHDINLDSLTRQEREYIESEVAKRYVWR
jgi:hypothetical protein